MGGTGLRRRQAAASERPPRGAGRGIRRNVELVRTVVDAVGPDVDVMADAYMSWDVGYAIRCIRALEDDGIRLRWLEEPVIPDDVRGLARVRAAVATPIAAGEHEATRYGFRELVEAGAVDILQPDVNRLGGITEARRVWALGETFGLDVVPHLGFAHNAHLAIASLATPLLEYLPPPRHPDEADEDQIFWVAFPDEPRAEQGRVTLSGAARPRRHARPLRARARAECRRRPTRLAQSPDAAPGPSPRTRTSHRPPPRRGRARRTPRQRPAGGPRTVVRRDRRRERPRPGRPGRAGAAADRVVDEGDDGAHGDRARRASSGEIVDHARGDQGRAVRRGARAGAQPTRARRSSGRRCSRRATTRPPPSRSTPAAAR